MLVVHPIHRALSQSLSLRLHNPHINLHQACFATSPLTCMYLHCIALQAHMQFTNKLLSHINTQHHAEIRIRGDWKGTEVHVGWLSVSFSLLFPERIISSLDMIFFWAVSSSFCNIFITDIFYISLLLIALPFLHFFFLSFLPSAKRSEARLTAFYSLLQKTSFIPASFFFFFSLFFPGWKNSLIWLSFSSSSLHWHLFPRGSFLFLFFLLS